MSGALLGRRVIYLTGMAAAIIYDALLVLDYTHVITPQNILAPALHANGNYVVQTLFFAPVMLLIITVVTDFVAKLVRERTQLTTKLEVVTAERAEIEAIIKSMGSALVAVDRQGKITMVNDAFEHLSGWARRDVIGVDLDTVLPLLSERGKKIESDKRPLLQLLNSDPHSPASAIQHVSRYYYAKKDGGIFPFVGSVAPIVLLGEVIGATTVFEDASSIKQIDQLKTNFVALASHQLKTPISEIQGYATNMLQGVTGRLTKQQTDYLTAIQEITLRCNKLITDLLDAVVLEQGSIRVNIEAVQLSKVIKRVVTAYQARVKQKSLKIAVIEPEQEITVRADGDTLVEIIGNVVANAVSYTKKHTTITIETKADGDEGVILVRDEGAGIDKNVLEHLFLKDDVLSSAPEAEGGTGVGLYLAKELLSLQKGKISVVSSTSKGTTMAIRIPLKGRKHDRSSRSN